MSIPTFMETHNLVAFLEKPAESKGFEQIIDFLNASSIKYALTVNPTLYTSCIEHFWTSTKVKTINEDVWLQALVDGKKIIINEASIRRDLRLDDAEGKDFSRAITPLFDTMMVQAAKEVGEGSELPTDPHHTPVLDLEEAKTAQAKEIASLKKGVKKLEKRRKMINNINQDVEITLVDEAQEKMSDQDMFGVNDLDGDEVIVDDTTNEKEDTALTTATITNDDEVTLAKTLIKIKAAKPKAKPKVITTAAIIITAVAIIRPKAKRIVMQKASKTLSPRPITCSPKPSQDKDKDSKQAAKLQEVERGELSIEEKSKLFVELINKKKKHFEMLRAKEEGEDIQPKQKRETRCIDFGAVKDRAVESSKRAGEELEFDMSKKQKLDKNVQAEVADDDSVKLKMCMEIVPEDEDDVTIDTTPLSSKSPTIIDYKIH
ncbi:hypothetical protein Tco_0375328, partial [Tanacetum coccineum]